MNYSIVRVGALLLALSSACAAANAAPASYCREYANQAVIAASQNMSHACGFTGSRWGLDYNVHYAWCISTDLNSAAAERQARDQGIVACHGGPTHNGVW